MPVDDSGPRYRTPSMMSGLLDVEVVRDEAGRVVIVVRGELDRMGVPLLTGCLREALEVAGAGNVVVLDLAGTDFVDVAGMRLLIEATGWAKARGMRLQLSGCQASLLRLLQICGLRDELEVATSR